MSDRNEESKLSDVQDGPQGVTILSKGGEQGGVETLSKREGAAKLESTVEVHVGDPRNPDGTKKYERII